MKAINKVLAYSSSSLWLTIIISLSINYHILNNSVFWTALVFTTLIMGIVLEVLYSFIYACISNFTRKINFSIPHKIAYKRYGRYKKNYNYLENVNYLENARYQEILAENNVVRNLWMSSLIGYLIILILLLINKNNSINEVKILIWLPFIFLLLVLANVRTEVLLKKTKADIYHFDESIKNNKEPEEVLYEFKNI